MYKIHNRLIFKTINRLIVKIINKMIKICKIMKYPNRNQK